MEASVQPGMRMVFFGTSEFAIPSLEAIMSSRHELLCAVSRPPRPAGRGRKLRHPPVYTFLMDHPLQVHQPPKLTEGFIATLADLAPDVMVTAAYGAWLPDALLAVARLGVVNVHPSLLPLYRGAAPVTRAILDGRDETGVSFMLTDSGWDTGPLLASFPLSVEERDTTGTLESRLARLAGSRIVQVLEEYRSGILGPVPQAGEPIYAEKVQPRETWLDWDLPAEELERRVRAFQPSPGARTSYRGRLLKITEASVSPGELPPGEILLDDGNLLVGCGGGGALRVTRLQPESRREMSAVEFLRGAGMESGDSFKGA